MTILSFFCIIFFQLKQLQFSSVWFIRILHNVLGFLNSQKINVYAVIEAFREDLLRGKVAQ